MMGILLLKKRVNRNKCSFATKQCMFGVFAIDEIPRYRGSPFPASRTLCHPAWYIIIIIKGELQGSGWLSWDQKNHHHDHPHPWYIIIIIRGELEGAGWLHCDWHPERPVPLPTEGWRSLPGVRRSVLDRQHRGNPIQSNPIPSNDHHLIFARLARAAGIWTILEGACALSTSTVVTWTIAMEDIMINHVFTITIIKMAMIIISSW